MTDRDQPPYRLKILLWHWGRRGAGPRYTLELARSLMRRQDVDVYLSVSKSSELIDQFRDLKLPMLEIKTYTGLFSAFLMTLNILSTRRKFSRYLQDNRINVVNSTMSHLWSRFVTSTVRRNGAVLLNTVHDAVLHPGENGGIKSWFYQPFKDADGYIALTNYVSQQLSDVHHIAHAKVTVIPLGPLFDPVTRVNEPHVRTGPLRLLFFGRILRYKGLERLIEAYGILRAEGQKVSLQITGAGDMSDVMTAVKMLPDITVNNKWVPEDKMDGVFTQADVVVLPYLESSQSGVIASAFAAGVPAIGTPIGGLPEQITHGVNGLVAADTSPAALASEIRTLAEDERLLATLKEGALNTAQQHFSWDKISTEVLALSRSCYAPERP
ncbi:MAG: glycosyltransferase family 4 protein, partial [Alphaproteobacteria bacterium]|nr:glycosyltransferase family 4 protein [Alphaproteobacteria bacterium]